MIIIIVKNWMLSNSAKCPCGSLSRNINIFNFMHSYISCTRSAITLTNHFWSLHESSFFNWVAIDNTKFLHALSFMYVLPKSTPCFISRWQRCGKLVKAFLSWWQSKQCRIISPFSEQHLEKQSKAPVAVVLNAGSLQL